MIQSAVLLMREHGVEATSFSQVIEHSGAPRGSIYHHFPGGKAELVEAATRYAGDFIAQGLVDALAQDDPLAAVRRFAKTWRKVLESSDFAAGCPVVAATLEGDRSPAARAAAGAAFAHWEDLLTDAFAAHGAPRERSRSLATLIIASVEGAVVLARAERATTPLDRVVSEIELLIAAVVEPVATE